MSSLDISPGMITRVMITRDCVVAMNVRDRQYSLPVWWRYLGGMPLNVTSPVSFYCVKDFLLQKILKIDSRDPEICDEA